MDYLTTKNSSPLSVVCCFWMLYVQVAIVSHNNVRNSGTLVRLVSIHTHRALSKDCLMFCVYKL